MKSALGGVVRPLGRASLSWIAVSDGKNIFQEQEKATIEFFTKIPLSFKWNDYYLIGKTSLWARVVSA